MSIVGKYTQAKWENMTRRIPNEPRPSIWDSKIGFRSHVWVGYTEESPDLAECHECGTRVTDPQANDLCGSVEPPEVD